MRNLYNTENAIISIESELDFKKSKSGVSNYKENGILDFRYKISATKLELIFQKSSPLCNCNIKNSLCIHYKEWAKMDIQHFDIISIDKKEVEQVIERRKSLF